METLGTTLVTVGLTCIIAAIVGGGLKAFQIELPVLKSGPRQLGLGTFGVVAVTTGFLLIFLVDDGDDGPTPTTSSQTSTSRPASPTLTAAATSTDSGTPVSGRGTVPPCDSVMVTVDGVEPTDGTLYVRLRVSNDAGNVPIELPPYDDVHLIDSGGIELAVDRFGNLGLDWGIGPEVRPDSTFSSAVVFQDQAGRAGTGRIEVANIRRAMTAGSTCSVRVEAVTLP